MKPLLSIIIPTKDRIKYLKSCIESTIRIESKKLEVIIQDNSENPVEVKEFVESKNDSRIKIFHTSGWLSAVDNCDLAVSNATGKYQCFIGDDDGVASYIMDFVEWMDKENIDGAISCSATYLWPDVKFKFLDSSKFSSTLTIGNYSGKIDNINVQKELSRIVGKGGTALGKLPRLYHGIVSQKTLQKLKTETGTFFPGPIPDMSNAVGIAKHLKSHVFVDYPIIISGQARSSAAGQSHAKKHVGLIENQKFLPKDIVEKWSEKIPFFWSGTTIWAESAFQGLQNTNNPLLDKFNYNYVYARCFLFEPNFSNEIKKCISNPLSYIKIAGFFSLLFFDRALSFLKNRLLFKLINKTLKKRYTGINSIDECIDRINSNFNNPSEFPWRK